MYIVYEYVACVLAVTVAATMMFAAYMMSLVLIEGGKAIWRLREGRLPIPRQTNRG